MSRRPATARAHRPDRRPPAGDEGRRQLRQEMLQEVLSLPVPAFDRLLARLLEACGYEGVQVLGEARGGADLAACTRSGLSCTRTLVQAKQYAEPVSRRFVDELRGAMLRMHAQQGLLLTTSTFYGPALAAAGKAGLLPVRLVQGEELLDLLVRHGLGVRALGGGRLALDQEFFGRLADLARRDLAPEFKRLSCRRCGSLRGPRQAPLP